MTFRHLAISATALLCGCSGASTAPSDAVRTAQAVRVLSGDLLNIGGRTVRLANARAPALPPQARCWGEAALAVQAASKAETLVTEAGSVKLTPEGEDADGVTLARVALAGRRDLGEALIFSGLAARRAQGRQIKADWDWCGPADFHRADGPGFDAGPQANPAFMAWVAAEQDRQVQDTLARMMIESGPPADLFDGS